MTLRQDIFHTDKKFKGRRGNVSVWSNMHDWPEPSAHIYDYEEELCDQLARFPSADQIIDLCDALRVATLRELSAEILNGGIGHIRDNTDRLDYAKLLNSWIATAEETIAAGRNVNRIAARRKANT